MSSARRVCSSSRTAKPSTTFPALYRSMVPSSNAASVRGSSRVRALACAISFPARLFPNRKARASSSVTERTDSPIVDSSATLRR